MQNQCESIMSNLIDPIIKIILTYSGYDTIVLFQDKYPELLSTLFINNIDKINKKNHKYVKYIHLRPKFDYDSIDISDFPNDLYVSHGSNVNRICEYKDGYCSYHDTMNCQYNNTCDEYYFTEDNGDNPFVIYIDKYNEKYKNGYKIWIYKHSIDYDVDNYEYYNIENYGIYLKNYDVIQKFIGSDSEQHQPGNSCLFKISKENRYLFVGHIIYEFTTDDDEILEYYSIVGNSSVPYPAAYGKKYLYIMLDYKFIVLDDFYELLKNKFNISLDDYKKEDAYHYFYSLSSEIHCYDMIDFNIVEKNRFC